MSNSEDSKKSIMESIWLTLWTYLFMMCFALSFYTKGTYIELGNTKFYFYRIISIIGAAILFILFAILYFIKKKEGGIRFNLKNSDIAILVFAVLNISTFIFSVDKSEALWGTNGWYMGFLTWGLILFFYICFSHFMKWKDYLWYIIMIPCLIVMIIGILNRFEILFIYDNYHESYFLSTIGNINWYCGYLSVFIPVFVALVVSANKNHKTYFLFVIFEIISLVAVITQGSISIILALGVTFLALMGICLKERKMWITFQIQVIICGLSMEISKYLVYFYGFNYEADNLAIKVIMMHTGLILCGLGFFLISLSRLLESLGKKWNKNFCRIIYCICISFTILLTVIYLFKTFNNDWGNGRGFIWKYTYELFEELNPARKFLGVGQDCYASYSYSVDKYANILDSAFGSARLTNAHSQVFTILINNGILGLVSYLFVIGTFFIDFCRQYKKDKNIFALAFLLCIITYSVNSLISFDQIMSTPYFFIFMGIGEAAISDKNFTS